jgi:putative glycosyl hydrolase
VFHSLWLVRILIVGLLVHAAVIRASAQSAHYGMNAHDVSGMTADKLTELGAGIVRVVYGWDRIEPDCKGCFTWERTDAWRDQARRTGRAIFGTLAYTPRWANGGALINTPPLRAEDWYDFVYATVDRYKDDVFLWGIWNEPNLDSYFRNGDRTAYEALVRTAASAIHAANPRAQVLGPEVSQHAIPTGWYAAVMDDVGSLFDIVTVHWYVDGPAIERFMDEGIRPWSMRKEVWLAEVGVKPCQTNFGEAGQALLYRRVLEAFQQRRNWWTGLMFYVLHDDPPEPSNCGSGITREDWSNRPAFLLYRAFMKAFP